ncbi:hypothetical protein AKJ16_DCAP26444 [Drosera capensis]
MGASLPTKEAKLFKLIVVSVDGCVRRIGWIGVVWSVVVFDGFGVFFFLVREGAWIGKRVMFVLVFDVEKIRVNELGFVLEWSDLRQKSYETKECKKGLKAADTILKKFSDHEGVDMSSYACLP